MKHLESFRELLAKKTQDTSLQNLVRFMREDLLVDMVAESLEKMARSGHKGDSANHAIHHFGAEMDPEVEPNMIHDALSHHASHYKAALGANKPDLANEHAKQIFKIMDFADQAQKHSGGKLQVQAVSPHAWERNSKNKKFTETDGPVLAGRKRPGQFVTDTKGWRYRGKDYSFLQQAPHEAYSAEVRRHGHDNAYPMEHIKVNGKYLDVQDVDPASLKGGNKHPFDNHPVLKHFEEPAGSRTVERDKQYRAEHEAYNTSDDMAKYHEKQQAMEEANPDAHAQRGSKPSDKVHKQVDPLKVEMPGKGQEEPKQEAAAPAKASKGTTLTDDQIKLLREQLSPEQFDRLMGGKKDE